MFPFGKNMDLRNSDLHARRAQQGPADTERLTEAEVERLIKATQDNRYGHRDATMVLLAYRHGLRAAELVDLRWEQIDFRTAALQSVGSSRARLVV